MIFRRPGLTAAGPAVMALAIIAVAWPTVQAEEVSGKSADEGVLLLRNGGIVRGRIVDCGDVFRVEQAGGSMVVPESLVRLHAPTLPEVYRKLSERVQERESAASRVALARWCITNQLLNEARSELQGALQLEPDREEARDLLRKLDDLGRPASRQRPAEKKQPAPVSLPPVSNTSRGESLNGLSREQARQFTRRIQPILMNNCAVSGCHGAESETGFRLERVVTGSDSNRNASERNLAEVLQKVDFDAPRKSALLTVTRENHGRRGRATFAGPRGDEQYAELRHWVQQVAQSEARRARPGQRPASRQSVVQASTESERAFSGPAKDPFGLRDTRDRRDASPAEPARAKGPSQPSAHAADPFDPRGFNQPGG
ncbi:MAG: hypothetical protein ACT4QC_15870 [Planctomycetaceae bacterium]